jgi:hypothetical protein
VARFGRRLGGATFPFTALGARRRRFGNSMTWPTGDDYTLPLTNILGNLLQNAAGAYGRAGASSRPSAWIGEICRKPSNAGAAANALQALL